MYLVLLHLNRTWVLVALASLELSVQRISRAPRRQHMGESLSDYQARIYAFIEDYILQYGRPPTNREIGAAVGILSTGHVDYHLSVLEKKGRIQREPKKSRGIRVLQPQPRGLPIEGTIAAGQPLDIYAADQREALDLTTHTREYVLLVRGDSMIEDHIADGDFVLIQRDVYINDADIIVATRRTGTAEAAAPTLNRLSPQAHTARFHPPNPPLPP